MKFFSEKKRSIQATRRKYGSPENKKEALARLREEREKRELKASMLKSIRGKNGDEFHFAYNSVSNSMVKRTNMKKDELKKMLKYIDCEIKRAENSIKSSFRSARINKKIVFDEKGQRDETKQTSVSKTEYESYLEELKTKRAEVIGMVGREDTK